LKPPVATCSLSGSLWIGVPLEFVPPAENTRKAGSAEELIAMLKSRPFSPCAASSG
jgi:hypothetical protein